MDRKVNSLIKNLQKKKLTIAFAESITCGLASEKLANCPGTSEVLKGSVVCYSEDVKKKLLKVPAKVIRDNTCESQKVTELLAKNLSQIIEADVHAAVTGLASKDGSETKSKPCGTVFLAVYFKGKMHSRKKLFRGTPLEIREKASFALYSLVRSAINE